MRGLHNINKSISHTDEYVGYANESIWRIHRASTSYGEWVAYIDQRLFIDAIEPLYIYGHTLRQISERLTALGDLVPDDATEGAK